MRMLHSVAVPSYRGLETSRCRVFFVTAVRLDLDLIVIAFNDSGLGMIRLKQMADGFGQYGVDFKNPTSWVSRRSVKASTRRCSSRF